uniref:Putative secreted protein n=1 Tax=Anopheles marajoara TaxID=58244 RepID=A0A2M4C9I0_9DIPT
MTMTMMMMVVTMMGILLLTGSLPDDGFLGSSPRRTAITGKWLKRFHGCDTLDTHSKPLPGPVSSLFAAATLGPDIVDRRRRRRRPVALTLFCSSR